MLEKVMERAAQGAYFVVVNKDGFIDIRFEKVQINCKNSIVARHLHTEIKYGAPCIK